MARSTGSSAALIPADQRADRRGGEASATAVHAAQHSNPPLATVQIGLDIFGRQFRLTRNTGDAEGALHDQDSAEGSWVGHSVSPVARAARNVPHVGKEGIGP